MILAEGLGRSFRTFERSRGLWGALTDMVRVRGELRHAVQDLSFEIRRGEAVALIGPNGAGKSTTVKLLTGVLKATEGRVRVGGLDPWSDRLRHVRQIGVVFGQRTQLWWDLAVIEALDLTAAMFGVDDATYRRRLAHFDDLLQIGPLLRTPVRQLSLGERMRCELAAALLHAPPVLFLDEPTIGLDVAVKLRLRGFLASLRDQGDTTLVLTTHDFGDVGALCPRVLLLAGGRLLHDGPLASLAARLGGRRTLRLELAEPVSDEGIRGLGLPGAHRVAEHVVAVPLEPGDLVPEAARRAMERAPSPVTDLRVEDTPIEELVARFYEGSRG